MNEVQEAHARLDAAEERTIRARYLTNGVLAEHADAGHAYFAALQRADFANAGRIHREHYDKCRPQIQSRVEAELVAAGVIRVTEHKGQNTWTYLTQDQNHARVCLRCGKNLADEMGVYVFVNGKCAPDRTTQNGSGPQVLLCVKHGSSMANNLTKEAFTELYRERYGRYPKFPEGERA